tara:strand:+ start:4394 stop:5326 length:933 start_codon:yes stop_codon:yes gene_type:complete
MKKDLSNIKKAKYLLDKNHCVAIPTETVYGLAANAYSDKATLKIFKLKKRPKFNPLIVHYFDARDIEDDCEINSDFRKLYNEFCPGPLTFILKLKKNSKISKHVTNAKKTLAVRFPKNLITKRLLKSLNYPLAAPSANIYTQISPVSKKDVKDEFGKKISFILDGGSSKVGLESTIIDLVNKVKILRLGGIEIDKISKVLKRKLKYSKEKNKMQVPGQSKLHYSPNIPIRLNAKKPFSDEAFILIQKRKGFDKKYFYLTKNKNLKEAGKNLYSTLRKIKNLKFNKIAIEKIPNSGLGLTINDRLKRASKR